MDSMNRLAGELKAIASLIDEPKIAREIEAKQIQDVILDRVLKDLTTLSRYLHKKGNKKEYRHIDGAMKELHRLKEVFNRPNSPSTINHAYL